MPVPREERERFDRQVASLRTVETDGKLSVAQARAVVASSRNDDDPPELELHRVRSFADPGDHPT